MNVTKWFKASSICLIGIGAMLLSAQASAATWNAYTYVPTTSITAGAAMKKVANRITKQTNGKLRVRLHLGGSLPIKATNITQAVSQGGTIKLADDGFPYGNIPIAGILNLPMLLTNEHDFETATKIMEPYLKKAYAKKGIVLLGIYHFPLQTMWSSKKLTRLADLSGMKMRVSSPQQAAFVRTFGGTPVTLGSPEVPSALQRGVVDGVFTASSGGAKVWKDLLHYNYRLGPNYFSSFIIANKAAFDRLSPSEQKTVKGVVANITPWATNTMRKVEKKITAKMAANGMTVTQPKSADVKLGVKKMSSYWTSWAKDQGHDTVEALKKIRAAIHK